MNMSSAPKVCEQAHMHAGVSLGMCLLTEAIYDAEYAPAMSVLTVAVYDTAVFFFFFYRPEKYNFDLYKGFFMEKKRTQIRQIFEGKKLQIARFFIISSSM